MIFKKRISHVCPARRLLVALLLVVYVLVGLVHSCDVQPYCTVVQMGIGGPLLGDVRIFCTYSIRN